MTKLFIIDDDPLDRMLMKLAIEKLNEDYVVIELDGADGAINSIMDEKPMATLLDMRMPEVDGIALLKTMRETKGLRSHPVFMVSGSSEPSDRDLAVKCGANYFFTKPSSLSGYENLAKDILARLD